MAQQLRKLAGFSEMLFEETRVSAPLTLAAHTTFTVDLREPRASP